MELSQIIAAFEAGLLEDLIDQSELDSLEQCWPELIEENYEWKEELLRVLVAAGVDCDWRRNGLQGQTPVELALTQGEDELVRDLLAMEARLVGRQRMVYRLVRRGNVELLQLFFEQQRVEKTEIYELLSYAVEEICTKFVEIEQAMFNYCLKTLLDVFYTSSVDRTEISDDQRKECIRIRLEIIIKETDFLLSNHVDTSVIAHNKFAMAVKTVAENIFVVDELWSKDIDDLGPRILWSRLMPRKVNFCLELFLVVLQGKAEYKGYVLFLDKQLVLRLVAMFGKELKKIVTASLETKRNKPPHDGRKSAPPRLCSKTRRTLAKLSRLYRRIKNFRAVDRMLAHIKLVKDIPLTVETVKKFGYAAFRRVVQVIGECCKNTDQTPNLSNRFHHELARHFSRQVLAICEQHRNVSTHELSLGDVLFRARAESGFLEDQLFQYCVTVQESLRESYRAVQFLRMYEHVRVLRSFLGRILGSTSIEQCRSLCWVTLREDDLSVEFESLYDFEGISILLNELMANSECEHLRERFEQIQNEVESAKKSMMATVEAASDFKSRVYSFISSLRHIESLDVAKKLARYYLFQDMSYFDCAVLVLLRKPSQLLFSAMNTAKFSADVEEKFASLHHLLVNRNNSALHFQHVHKISQLILADSKRYTKILLNDLKVKDLTMKQFNTIYNGLTNAVYNPLHKKFKAGMFDVDEKFKILEQLLKTNKIKFDPKILNKVREVDFRTTERLFMRMLKSLRETSDELSSEEDEFHGLRTLAVQYGLLEICSALFHTPPFRKSSGYMTAPVPLLAGKQLRNALSHDMSLLGIIFLQSNEIFQLTVEVLYKNRWNLLNFAFPDRTLPTFEECSEKYERRKRFLQEQTLPLSCRADELLSRLRIPFDVFGRFYVIEFGTMVLRNVLDVMVFRYQDEAIAFFEAAVEENAAPTSASSLFKYLWNRLGTSAFLGLSPVFFVRMRFDGENCFLPGDEDASEDSEEFGPIEYHPVDQIEHILKFCLLAKRADKFDSFYVKYGSKFDLTSSPCLRWMGQIPDVVDRLSGLIPWEATTSEGYTLMHLFCYYNNAQALRVVLATSMASQLCRSNAYGVTPLSVALQLGCFEAAKVLLDWGAIPRLNSIYTTIAAGRNDLLEHFIPALESNPDHSEAANVVFSLCCNGNVEAFRYFKSQLSTEAFQQLLYQSGEHSLMNDAMKCNMKQSTLEEFMVYPEVCERINSSGVCPLSVDSQGKFVHTRFLISKGARVNFHTIWSAMASNSYHRTRRFHELLPTGTELDLTSILEFIVMQGLDKRLLEFFLRQVTSPESMCRTLVEIAIYHHNFEHCQYLCDKYPIVVQQIDPLIRIIDAILHWNSLKDDKKFLQRFIERHYANIPLPPKILQSAAQLYDSDIIYTLIAKLPSINEIDEDCCRLTLHRSRSFDLPKSSIGIKSSRKPRYASC